MFEGDVVKTSGMLSPPEGLEGLVEFRAFILGWRFNVIFRSEAHEDHLWHPENIIQFPSDITCVVPLNGGFWVGTKEGAYFVDANSPDPAAWKPIDGPKVSILGGTYIDHKLLGDSEEPTALLCSDRWLYAGSDNGQLVPITLDKFRVNGEYAKIEVLEKNGEKMLVIGVKHGD